MHTTYSYYSTSIVPTIDMNERILLLFFNLFVVLSSIIGDSTILISIIRYNAIKLNKAVVTIILHLAVNDLLQTLFMVIPQTVSIAFGSVRWVLGVEICYLFDIFNYICHIATFLLTCLLSTCKLLTLMCPFRARTWSTRKMHFICGIFWTVSLLQPASIRYVMCIFRQGKHYWFNYHYYMCSCKLYAPEWLQLYGAVFYYTVHNLSIIILIATSVLILYKARKQAMRRGRTLRWQGVMTVTITTVVFLLSNLPRYIVHMLSIVGKHQTTVEISETAYLLLNVNIMANFYVYSITVQSFRDFLRSGMLSVARCSRNRGRQLLGILSQPPVSDEDRSCATRDLKETAVAEEESGRLKIKAVAEEESGRLEIKAVAHDETGRMKMTDRSKSEPDRIKMTIVFNEEDCLEIGICKDQRNDRDVLPEDTGNQ